MGMGSALLFQHVDELRRKKKRKKMLAVVESLTKRLIKLARSRKQGPEFDLEDAVVVLEAMVKYPNRFLKELKAVSLKYDKYGHHRGLD